MRNINYFENTPVNLIGNGWPNSKHIIIDYRKGFSSFIEPQHKDMLDAIRLEIRKTKVDLSPYPGIDGLGEEIANLIFHTNPQKLLFDIILSEELTTKEPELVPSIIMSFNEASRRAIWGFIFEDVVEPSYKKNWTVEKYYKNDNNVESAVRFAFDKARNFDYCIHLENYKS